MSENQNLEERLDSIAAGENSKPKVQVIGNEAPKRRVPPHPTTTVSEKPVVKQEISKPKEEEIEPTVEEEYVEEEAPEEVEEISTNEEEEEGVVDEEPVEEVVQTETTSNNDDNFISEGFANFEKSLDLQQDMKKNPKKRNSILDNIHVDLNNIEIMQQPDLMTMSAIEDIILDDKTTMLVTCCQSSYTSEMSALKNQEIDNITNSDVDYYTYMKRLYQTINKHMENTSVGKMPYGEWLHNTSYFDIDTLLYGIYCQTFPYENKYSITCPECENTFDAIVNNNTLIEMRGEGDTYAKINEIVSGIHEAKDLVANSQVHKSKRVLLNESKIIVDIRIPSVYDYLEEVVSKSSDRELEDYQNALGLSLFIEKIFMPNILLLEQTKNLKYIDLDIEHNQGKMLTTIANLSYYDSLQLTDEINNFIEKYRVTYSIRNITCPHCGRVMTTIPLDMQTVLFSVIRRARIDR